MKSSAKELFLSFLGSKYQMMREGVIERYLSYNVSKEEEMTWIEELFQSLYIRLQRNINDLNALHQMTYLIECHDMVEHVSKLYDLLWGNTNSITHAQEVAISLGRIIHILKAMPKASTGKEYFKMLESLKYKLSQT